MVQSAWIPSNASSSCTHCRWDWKLFELQLPNPCLWSIFCLHIVLPLLVAWPMKRNRRSGSARRTTLDSFATILLSLLTKLFWLYMLKSVLCVHSILAPNGVNHWLYVRVITLHDSCSSMMVVVPWPLEYLHMLWMSCSRSYRYYWKLI